MNFQDKVKILFNLALFPEVVDVFIQEHPTDTTRFMSVQLEVNGKNAYVLYEADLDASANKIICILERRIREKIKDMEEA